MTDPLALALIVCAISAVAAVACLVPIRRAASIDPVEALRAE
jgi:ABC-type lipoprotein release transport system permease subunit